MEQQNIEFPISPKEHIGAITEKPGIGNVEFAWHVLLSAAAHADQRLYKQVPTEKRGENTLIVYKLLEPFQTQPIEAAHLDDFYPFINGVVFAGWASRYERDEQRRKERFFSYKAMCETVTLAELRPEVHSLFMSGVNNMESQGYFNELTQGVKSLVPDADFPYRSMKVWKEKQGFWNYLINGTEKQPGALKTAAALQQQSKDINNLLRDVFGPDVDTASGRTLLEVVLHVQTSKRKYSETARGILTPLMKSFDSQNFEIVRETLRTFALERPELVPFGFDKFLVLDRKAAAKNRASELVATKEIKRRDLELSFSDILAMSADRQDPYSELNQSKIDPATNTYVAQNRWRTYRILKGRETNERITLLDVEDINRMDNKTKIYGIAPRLRFLKQTTQNDEVGSQKVKTRQILAKDFFLKIRAGEIVAGPVEPNLLKQMAVTLGYPNEITEAIVGFINK